MADPFTRLALVGDTADGYPGMPAIGAETAAQLLNRCSEIENYLSNVLAAISRCSSKEARSETRGTNEGSFHYLI